MSDDVEELTELVVDKDRFVQKLLEPVAPKEIERKVKTIIREVAQKYGIKVMKVERRSNSLTVKFSDGAVLTYAGGNCYLAKEGKFSLTPLYDLIYKLIYKQT